MNRYIAFLRGINVAGNNKIKMDDLKAIFQGKYTNVATYIQSGNVAFDAATTEMNELRAETEQMLLDALGYPVVTLIRSQQQILEILCCNPFGDTWGADGLTLYVNLLSEVPDRDKMLTLEPFKLPREEIRLLGTEIYFLTPHYGNTKLSNAFIEKKLGVSGTVRNWATMNKAAAL